MMHGNDYEIRLSNGRPLSIYSPNAANYTTVLQVWKNAKIQQRLATNGLDPNDLPSGWSGGLRTNDVYAAGTVGAGSGGAVNAYMNSSGNIYASNDINVGHQVNTQYVWASGILTLTIFILMEILMLMADLMPGSFILMESKCRANCSPNGLQALHQMDYCYHVLVVNGLRHLVQQVFLQKIKALAWLIILTQMLVHVIWNNSL
jgi:hypothetical protein